STIASPRTATSPRYHALPLPSTMRPFLSSRSEGGVCAAGCWRKIARRLARTTAAQSGLGTDRFLRMTRQALKVTHYQTLRVTPTTESAIGDVKRLSFAKTGGPPVVAAGRGFPRLIPMSAERQR